MAVPRLILLEGLRRLGRPGLAGAMLLLAGLVAGGGWVLPAARERDQTREQVTRAEARLARVPTGQAAPPSAEQRRAAFYQALPAEAKVSHSIERLYAAAAAERISLERGEYTQVAIANTRLARYQIVLPVEADYGQIRRFLAAALADVRGLHLDDISLQRPHIGVADVEARLQFSLYLVRP